MQTFYIKARKTAIGRADVYAAGESHGLDKIGTITYHDGAWEPEGSMFGYTLKGACMDVARRHFATEPGMNNPDVNLIYRSK